MIDRFAWWNALVHGGCLIAPARLEQHFDNGPAPLESWRRERVRVALERFLSKKDKGLWIETVLVEALGHQISAWPSVTGDDWTVKSLTGESIRPRRVFDPEGQPLPLFVSDNERIGIGRGRRDVARAIEWLRKKDLELAIVTNGRQWRIVYAGETAEAWAESSVENWFAEGKTAPALEALRQLLNPEALRGPLLQAVLDTRKGQNELSAALGERVRQAVELLVVSCSKECDLALDSGETTLSDVYAAGVRMVMRLVVLLFAESRDLLPMSEAAYFRSYSLRNLFETLEREGRGSGGAQRLRQSYAAWPRIIALCRLVHKGSPHSRLAVLEYGGELFLPGDPEGKGISRALAAIEATLGPSDLAVQQILTLITQAPIKIRQGRGTIGTMFPVDFSQIDTEYIGILYEGLLDYELRRAAADQPQVILAIGDQPILPLRRLEAMTDAELKSLLEKMKVKGATTEADGEDEEEADDDEDALEDVEAEAPDEPRQPADFNDRHEVYHSALEWARRAALAAKLVKRNAPPKDLDAVANSLIESVRAPGEYYLVRFGGTRKGSGTFYTVPALARPTVRRTLEPLLRDENGPRHPEEILGIKVCDPACGSGSFPLAALRQINEALYESLIAHGWLKDDDGIIRPLDPPRPTPEWLLDAVGDLPGVNEPIGPVAHDLRIKARLMRHVVERCLYGVDINRLAVELTRTALWIETMDPGLPFGFLDHKFKVGNALVGCWFDRFQDYPILAWQREGGDKVHPTFVNHAPGIWTKAIKEALEPIKEDLVNVITGAQDLFGRTVSGERVHEQALRAYEELHNDPTEPDAQKAAYQELRNDRDFHSLKMAFDGWCAVWFWPAEKLADEVPTQSIVARAAHLARYMDYPSEGGLHPTADSNPDLARVVREIENLAQKHGFFHWELEFPDVFSGSDPGFHAVIGNPPWEIQKPNSKEWFSNLDPLYRSYGKQVAMERQRELFRQDAAIETQWLVYNADLKAASNWVRSAGDPFSASGGISLSRSREQNQAIFRAWEAKQKTRQGHAPKPHPFVSQGSADINTYKLFLEQGLSIVKSEGRIGFIVPSGIYTDRGAVDLRDRFLGKCRWEWLFGFENRDGIFNIHRSFKFCPIIVQKGGETERVQTAFMRRSLSDWERSDLPLSANDRAEGRELVEGKSPGLSEPPRTLFITREQILRFSPKSRAFLEVRDPRDVEILETMTANGIPLGDESEEGWGVKYAREFDMTNDSKLFPPREKWEADGYRADEYGHWLKGNWQPLPLSANDRVAGRGLGGGVSDALVLSRDGTHAIRLDEIENVALPLYQGVMVHQFDFASSIYVDGAGNQAKWQSNDDWDSRLPLPQFLMSQKVYSSAGKYLGVRFGFRGISNPTNSRTTIGSVIPNYPTGNMLPVLTVGDNIGQLCALACCLNSLSFDFVARIRFAGATGAVAMGWFALQECSLPSPLAAAWNRLSHLSQRLMLTSRAFANEWEAIISIEPNCLGPLAISSYERLRTRCIIDAAVAHLYGLTAAQFAYILRDCDHPTEQVTNKAFARNLDPKGFWRVDKNLDPELRHTVLAQVAFADLKTLIRTHGEEEGLRRFVGSGPDDGWMLPETVCLADYNLGHDERAKRAQPVASRLGPRFYDWQLKQTPEESWEECRRHAAKIRAIRSIGLPEGHGTGSTEGGPQASSHGTGSTASTRSAKLPTTGDLFAPQQERLID